MCHIYTYICVYTCVCDLCVYSFPYQLGLPGLASSLRHIYPFIAWWYACAVVPVTNVNLWQVWGCFCPNFGKISYRCLRPPPSLKGKAWNIFPFCGFMKKLCIKMSWLRQNNIWLWYDSWFWCQIWHFGILLNFTIVCQTFTSKTTSLRHVFDKVPSAK